MAITPIIPGPAGITRLFHYHPLLPHGHGRLLDEETTVELDWSKDVLTVSFTEASAAVRKDTAEKSVRLRFKEAMKEKRDFKFEIAVLRNHPATIWEVRVRNVKKFANPPRRDRRRSVSVVCDVECRERAVFDMPLSDASRYHQKSFVPQFLRYARAARNSGFPEIVEL